MNYQVEKCLTCCWARIYADRIFCLFAENTCMKHDQVFRNLKYHRSKINEQENKNDSE